MESENVQQNRWFSFDDQANASDEKGLTKLQPAVRIIRGDTTESFHHASIAVVDENGNLTHKFGDPNLHIMSRSSIKPFQLIPLLTTGAAEHFGFTQKELAIMCGSHNGSDIHREVVISNLKKSDSSSDDLQCGSHIPLEMRLNHLYPKNEEDKDPLRHNCSGKHSGFLALTKFLEQPIEKYLDPNSKEQQMIKEAVAELCEFPSDKMHVGTDGCSAPNFSMPLMNLAIGFKNLTLVQAQDEKTRDALSIIRSAIVEFPEMISGNKRPDLDIMKSFPNNAVCKVGAESCEGIGFSEQKIGISVKIHDGGNRALPVVLVETLKQLGIIDKIDKFPLLKKYVDSDIKNYRKLVTGKIVADFKLESV